MKGYPNPMGPVDVVCNDLSPYGLALRTCPPRCSAHLMWLLMSHLRLMGVLSGVREDKDHFDCFSWAFHSRSVKWYTISLVACCTSWSPVIYLSHWNEFLFNNWLLNLYSCFKTQESTLQNNWYMEEKEELFLACNYLPICLYVFIFWWVLSCQVMTAGLSLLLKMEVLDSLVSNAINSISDIKYNSTYLSNGFSVQKVDYPFVCLWGMIIHQLSSLVLHYRQPDWMFRPLKSVFFRCSEIWTSAPSSCQCILIPQPKLRHSNTYIQNVFVSILLHHNPNHNLCCYKFSRLTTDCV